jgi:D-arabinose 1-dehydrogenase-like Zn-dependent alcohol dehydrogenase
MEGIVSIIGLLTGTKPKDSIMETLSRICTIRGVYVGSREQMEDMVKEMEEHNIHPVVDEKVFTLEQAKEAYEYLVSVPSAELSNNSY